MPIFVGSLQGFLGLTGNYHQFITSYATLAIRSTYLLKQMPSYGHPLLLLHSNLLRMLLLIHQFSYFQISMKPLEYNLMPQPRASMSCFFNKTVQWHILAKSYLSSSAILRIHPWDVYYYWSCSKMKAISLRPLLYYSDGWSKLVFYSSPNYIETRSTMIVY